MLSHTDSPSCRLEMHIRPARLQDIAVLLALRAAALHGIREFYSPGQIARWIDAMGEGEFHDAIAETDDALICLAIDQGEDACPVGFAHVGYGTSVYLHGLYVDPGWQRRGIGSALIGAAHARCRTRHVARIIVAASLDAEPFYARHGYARVERISWHPSGHSDEPAIPALKMVKELR